jgi:hypothetical protein
LIAEGISVSNDGIRFMDRIMTGSPLRDGKKWTEEGRVLFLEGLEHRKRKWKLKK